MEFVQIRLYVLRNGAVIMLFPSSSLPSIICELCGHIGIAQRANICGNLNGELKLPQLEQEIVEPTVNNRSSWYSEFLHYF